MNSAGPRAKYSCQNASIQYQIRILSAYFPRKEETVTNISYILLLQTKNITEIYDQV